MIDNVGNMGVGGGFEVANFGDDRSRLTVASSGSTAYVNIWNQSSKSKTGDHIRLAWWQGDTNPIEIVRFSPMIESYTSDSNFKSKVIINIARGSDETGLGSGDFAFAVNSSNKAALGVGTMTPATALEVVGVIRSSSLAGSGVRAVYANASGSLQDTSSDARLKVNVTPLTNSVNVLQALNQLRGVTYNWNQNTERGRDSGTQTELGMIAQEVQAVLPWLVNNTHDGYLSLDYSKMSGFLIEVAKAQQQQIANTQNNISALQSGKLNLTGGTINGNLGVTGSLNVTGPVNMSNNLTVTGNITSQNIAVTNTATIRILKVTGPAEFGGDIRLAGAVNTKQAITKKFKASLPIPAGSVVVMDPLFDGQVMMTNNPNDTKVIGVTVTEAVNADDEIEVAIGGQVQVGVDALTIVASGDMITSDTTLGKARPNNTPIVGSVLGKATSTKDANNLIWILITLQ